MSTDINIRPVGAAAAVASAVQPSSPAVNEAIPTELPPSQTVTAGDGSATVRNDMQDQAQNQFFVSHQAHYDTTAASMVYQVVNSKTSEVVEQYPDEAVLRRRAYFNRLDLQKDIQRDVAPPQAAPTDRTV
jgi:hypothetical protein